MLDQLTDPQRRVLAQLQGDLPDGPEPYDEWAARAGLTTEEFLAVAQGLIEAGVVRKVCALVNHRRAGFLANAMCVWQVPAERVDEAGRRIAAFTEVTHCYRRPVCGAWPYALFCMVHAPTREQCEAVARRIAEAIEPTAWRILYSTRELKKRSVRLAP